METMFQGLRFNHLALRSLVLAVGFACAWSSASVAAPTNAKNPGPLSPLLAELAKPAVAAKPPAVQEELLGVATEEPGGLIREGQSVQVTARFAAGALSALPQLREAGADVVGASRDEQTVTLSVAPEDLPAIASVPGIAAVWQARRPIAYGVEEGGCEGGSVLSEGLPQLQVDDARAAFNLRGRGITIGVLSDSYDTADEAANGGPIATHAAGDIASNDLPGPASSCADQQLPVGVLAEGGADGADEGRAMLQIIHDLAPHAQLAFATAFKSEGSFAQNIERLAQPVSAGGAGADVIVDDVAWFEEPFFQDGPVAAAINKVTAEGVTYLTATGNDNLVDSGRDVASWETSGFRDSGSCPLAVFALKGFNGNHCLDFDPSGETDDTFGITVEAGKTLTVDLQWAEPWYGVNTDLDAFLLSGGAIVAESVEGNSGPKGTQRPVEIVQWTNSTGSERTVQLAINRFDGGDPRLKFILMQNGGGVSATEYPESSAGDVVGPSIFGHAGDPSAISVAAVPFNNSGKPERYSSRGPVVHLFAPVQGTTPAAEFLSPETIAKPDLAATDCGATTFFASLSAGRWRFCGTSAAAPHAAAVAALLRQAKPAQPAASYREALTATAAPVGAFGPSAVGAGLVDAFAALGSLPGPLEGEDGPSTSVAPIDASPAPAPADLGGSSGPSPTPSGGPAAPPDTLLSKHPGKLVRTRGRTARVVFRFGSDQAGSSFLCKVGASRFRPCGSRVVRRFGLGPHAVAVKAVSSAGLADPTPALVRFRVRHVS
jgi:hypothetical protein